MESCEVGLRRSRDTKGTWFQALVIVPVYVLLLLLTIVCFRRFAYFQENDHFNDFGYLHHYAAANKELPPASPDRVVFMGDSITRAWVQFDPGFFRGDMIDRGYPGQTSKELLVRFRQDVIDLHPHTVHLLCGVNDLMGLTGPTTPENIVGNIASMVELARAHHIQVILGTLLPSTSTPYTVNWNPSPEIQRLNAMLREYAAREHVLLVDYYTPLVGPDGGLRKGETIDGLHPSLKGYRIMEAQLAKTLAACRAQGNAAAECPEIPALR